MWVVSRPVCGVTINGREYLEDKQGNLMCFKTKQAAKQFLSDNGYSVKDTADEGIEITLLKEKERLIC